jgi:very-short-patch-repair endonuclease
MHHKLPIALPHEKHNARQLRRNATYPEIHLWNHIRGSRLAKLKFRRQHSIGPFIVDFYCHEQQLVIELDGDSHNGRAPYDASREAYLRNEGLKVIRFGNDDVLDDVEAVLRAILLACGRNPETGEQIAK